MNWRRALMCLFLPLDVAALPAGPASAAPELLVDIDFNDEVLTWKDPVTEATVEKLVRDLHAGGAQTLLVRMGYPGYRSKFLDEHPHCQWTARDGKTHFEGLMSYAWSEARAFRVAQAKELLDLGADGIHCSSSAHCRHLPNVKQDDYYGFEQPVVDEFRKRHGVDIRTAAEFDKAAWHSLKGEFMNQLCRELAEVCHARNKELWVGLQLGTHTHLFGEWLVNSRQALDHRLAQWTGRVLDHGFDGIDIHEACNFEACPGGMEILRRLRDRLGGKELGPLPE